VCLCTFLCPFFFLSSEGYSFSFSALSSYVFLSVPVHYIFHLFSYSLFHGLYFSHNLIKDSSDTFCFAVGYKDNVGLNVWSHIPSSEGLPREIKLAMYKIILPTNALFIKNIKCYNVYLTPSCFGPSWTIIREYTFVSR
jgi:hypothetical protein